MSNDGSTTPEPGSTAGPNPDRPNAEQHAAEQDTPTQAYPAQGADRQPEAPTEAFPAAGTDAPTQAFPAPGQPWAPQPAPGGSAPGQPWSPQQSAPQQPAQPWAPQPPAGAPATSAWPTPGTGSPAAQPADPYAAPTGEQSREQTGASSAPHGEGDAPRPGYPQPGYAQPGTPSGGYPQPGYPQPGTPQPGQGGGYPPAGGGYPPAPGQPYPQSPYGQYPGPTQGPTTDGVSIAALVTGILGTSVVAIVLGVIGLRRTKKNGTQGRGFAIAGIVLGALATLAWVGIGVAITAAVVTHNNHIDTLHSECAAGDMESCTDLYYDSDTGSDEEEFGRTCGDRTDGTMSCETFEEGFTYGDNADLDALWDACGSGDAAACDQLYSEAPLGSEYEEFGSTCGGTTDGAGFCDTAAEEPLAEDDAATGETRGSDPELDALWDACEAGDGAACDTLYWEAPFGSEYEEFGSTCGNRVEFAASCESELAG